ncbi:MAG: adenylate/guanylate cyclase domain-containing protein [Bacteroidota bacterium]
MIKILKATRKNASPSKVMSDMIKIEELIKENSAQYLITDFLLEKGNFYFDNESYEEAIPTFEMGLMELKKSTNTPYYKEEKMQMLKSLAESYLKVGDYENASLTQSKIIKEKEKQIEEEAQLKGIQYSANLALEQNKNKQALLEGQNTQQKRLLALAGVSLLSLIIFGFFTWRQSKAIATEKQKSEDLLFNVIPPVVAKKMQKGETLIADKYQEATIIFIDLVGFTRFSSNATPEKMIHLLNVVFSKMDQLTEAFDLEKIKTIGDCYMAVSGVPVAKKDHLERAIDFCLAVMKNLHGQIVDGHKIQLKIGIESGPVIAGVMGQKRLLFDLWGDAVNTASRMEANGVTGKIQTTKKVFEKVKYKYPFTFRKVMNVKGKGEMEVYCL